jgi:hypothetical protein
MKQSESKLVGVAICRTDEGKKIFAKLYEQGDVGSIVYLMKDLPVDSVIDFYQINDESILNDLSDYIASFEPIEHLNYFFRDEMIKYLLTNKK